MEHTAKEVIGHFVCEPLVFSTAVEQDARRKAAIVRAINQLCQAVGVAVGKKKALRRDVTQGIFSAPMQKLVLKVLTQSVQRGLIPSDLLLEYREYLEFLR